jgi:deoxycytidine triphosphate deaminase
MSIIPFIVDTANRTIVCNKSDFYNSKGREGDVVLIEDIDPSQLNDFRNINSHDANTSYDLTVGTEYIDLLDKSKRGIYEDQPIELQPGAAVIIETAEYVHFPKSRFGHIVPKVSRLHEGVSNTSSKVDPGYEGKLSIAVFNLGKNTTTLRKGSKFCTLYILSVDTTKSIRAYQKSAKSLPPGLSRNYLKLLITKSKDYSWVSILISLMALSMSILAWLLSIANMLK